MGFVIAIDGPAASGKGTLAARLGVANGLPVLDSGLLYRAVAFAVRAAGADPDDPEAAAAAARELDPAHLSADALGGGEIGELASRVAVHPQVRAPLVAVQRAFAGQSGGAVLDGRDIGTVIWPQAEAKLFITATPEKRAERRWRQLQARGEVVTLDAILADILGRDARDRDRAVAPLIAASDAVLLDTTDLDIDGAFDAAQRIVETARGRSCGSAR
jgi:cytidylate kinase